MLSEKERRLIRILLDVAKPISARSLASRLGVSVRSVKAYVRRINAEAPPCITSGRDGYRPQARRALELIEHAPHEEVPQTSEERVAFLLRRLLKGNGALNIYDLCEELFVSLTTLKTDLGRLRRTIAPFKLDVTQDDGMLTLDGLEQDKRRLAADLLYGEASVSFLDLKTIGRAFPDIDTIYIGSCVKDTLAAFHHFANDYSIANLVLHIAITIDRIRSGNGLENLERGAENPCARRKIAADRQGDGLRPHDHELAETIIDKLNAHFHVAFSPVEADELSLLLASRTTMLDYRTASADNIEQFIGPDCLSLVREIIADLSGYYGIDLAEREFLVRFALHIKNLLLRAQAGGLSRNPLTQQIRSSCPLLYDTAVAEASLIKRRTGFEINDDEISYIAFHLGSTLETQKQLTNKVRAVLYCPSYYDLDAQVMLFFNRYFEADALITDIVTAEADLAHLRGVELLIATVPINEYLDIPTCRISLFPTERDAAGIRSAVDALKRGKRRLALRNNLQGLMRSDLFGRNERATDRAAIIHQMAERLRTIGDVEADFEDRVLERERLSSTAFASFALPHAVRLCSRRSSISVMASRTPIPWGDARVHLVVMLSFCRRDRTAFYEMFDPLVSVLSDSQHVLELSRSPDYGAFITKLCDMLE